MKDDTGRPGSGDKGFPGGTRARNRTTILGAGRVSSLLGGEAQALQGDPLAAEGGALEEDLDPLGLDTLEQEEPHVVSPPEHDDFQSLDEIFGTSSVENYSPPPPQDTPPVRSSSTVTQDASSTLLGDLGLEDDFQSALDVFDPPTETPAPISAPRIVRANPPAASPVPQRVVDDHLDPFAGIESDAEESTGIVEPSPGADAHELEDTFGEIATSPTPVEEYPVAPKIVRTGEIGVSNERVITPPSRVATIPSKVVATETESVVSQGQEMRSRHIEMDAELMTDQRDQIYWRNETPLVGFLVTYDHDPKGSYVELRQGRLIVSSQREESGSCLVVLGESVSPMHAIMRVAAGGHVQVLDQLSESGTRVRHYGQAEEAFLSGEKSSLSHGDIVFFGDRKFHVLLVAGEGEGN